MVAVACCCCISCCIVLVVYSSFNWCKRTTCTGGGCYQLQLALVVLFHLATGADSLLAHMVYMNIFGASLSEPHMYEKYGERVYIYIVRFRPRDQFMPGAKWTTWPPFALPLRATQITAADSFKREGNRMKRSGHSNLSLRQGYRHCQKESRQLIFLHAQEFHRTLSEVVYRVLTVR